MIVFSVVFAALVAVGASVAIERIGGIAGGLLATLPTTIVPAGWAVWAASADPATFRHSFAVVPLGMLCNTAFLSVWSWLPPRLRVSGRAPRFLVVMGTGLVLWALGAAVAVRLGRGPWGAGFGALALLGQVAIAAMIAARGRPPAGKRASSSIGALALRAVFAGAVVAAAGAFARRGEGTIAGMAAVFPVIFLTTMAGLWWSHGEELPRRAVGPMMIGAWSIGGYATLAAWIYPVVGPAWGTAIAWGAMAAAQFGVLRVMRAG
jgi:hypothetical protein